MPPLAIKKARLADLSPYPGNPRRGNIEAIAESLETNGQYRPIVVQKSTNVILAGNHTAEAAKHLGWKDVQAVYVDVDDAEARRIVLADNRTADLGYYDTDALLALLADVPDLTGTGYAEDDYKRLAQDVDIPLDLPDAFPEFDLDIPTDHQCPKCGFEW